MSSLKEIAAMTGTSVSTVSRVLNHTSKSCASKELQDRIWEAARKTGYRPNEAARSLRAGEVKKKKVTVSVVLARIASLDEEPFFAELFRSLEAELLKNGTVIDQVIYAKESLKQDISGSSGVIILGRCSRRLLNRILAQNKNVVGIWRNPMEFDVDEVMSDGKKAAEMAMQYLFDLGHSRIAYIGSCSYESRYVGYCDMLIKNRIPMDYELICPTNQTRKEAETAILKLLKKKQEGITDFSAVFCANDATAVRVLELLKEKKKELHREQISVISIDDIEEAQNTQPFLTTVRIPRGAMTHMAVWLLLDRIAGGHDEVVRVELPGRMIRRASCAKLTGI